MKRKIVSLILALTFIFSINLTALADVNEFIQPKLLMEYTFDDDILDLPQGWQPYNAITSANSYLQRNIAKSGKALRITDKDLVQELRFISDPIKVEPGKRYSLVADTYGAVNQAMIQLWFQDEAGKNIVVNTGYTVSPQTWT